MYDPDLIACMKLSASWMAITEQGLTMIDFPIWERDFKPFSLNAANKTAQFIRYYLNNGKDSLKMVAADRFIYLSADIVIEQPLSIQSVLEFDKGHLCITSEATYESFFKSILCRL